MAKITMRQAISQALWEDRITSYNVCYTKLLRLSTEDLKVITEKFKAVVLKEKGVDFPQDH